MNNLLKQAKERLQSGDIKAIADKSGIPYQTLYKVLNGDKSTRQNEIIKAVTDFLRERNNELEKLKNELHCIQD